MWPDFVNGMISSETQFRFSKFQRNVNFKVESHFVIIAEPSYNFGIVLKMKLFRIRPCVFLFRIYNNDVAMTS